MVQLANTVLTITDLSRDSDAAIVLAARIAERLEWGFEVTHGMGMVGQPLRHLAPSLDDVQTRMVALDRAARDQLGRLLPERDVLPSPVIDFGEPAAALRHRAKQAGPALIVLPARWSHGSMRAVATSALLNQLRTPTIVVRDPAAARLENVRVVLESGATDETTVQAARGWAAMLQGATYGLSEAASGFGSEMVVHASIDDLIASHEDCDGAPILTLPTAVTRRDRIAVPA